MAYGSVLGRNTKPQFVPTFAISGPLPGDTVTVSYGGTTVEAVEDNGVWYAKAWAYGSYTVKLIATAGTKTTTVNVDEVKLYEVMLTYVNTTLNNNSWDVIRKVADAGQASDYWNVGDRKAVVLNGKVGALTLSNYTTYCFILGFNHNAELEGNNTIHFQFGKTALSGGTDIAFVDAGYNDSYNDSVSARFVMNIASTNSGGWKNSYMRNTICSAFLNAVPNELQSVIIECSKYTDNTGGGQDIADYVTTTSDKEWLLSEFEIQGVRTYANSAEQNKQIQYIYYKNGNSKAKYKHHANAELCAWHLRSVAATTVFTYCYVSPNTSGTADAGSAYWSLGFAPCFCV